jgi:uncharacterized protein (TIGR01777 family)
MKIVIPGGSGQVGHILARHFHQSGHNVTVLSRRAQREVWPVLAWDGATEGPWIQALENSDVCINLAGRSVNCRYGQANRREINDSRVKSTKLLNQVVGSLHCPPRVWLNASTATIYRHALDRPMDEAHGELGGNEPGAPDAWNFSIDVAKSWEQAFFAETLPRTRKVAMRSAITFSPDRGGAFDVLLSLVRHGLGGRQGSGQQFVSWIHETDLAASVEWLIEHNEWQGVVNLAAPSPLRNRDFMRAIRQAWGNIPGLPLQPWMVELGAVFMKTESELILKSRQVVPGRLAEAGFVFQYTEWRTAAHELVKRWKKWYGQANG